VATHLQGVERRGGFVGFALPDYTHDVFGDSDAHGGSSQRKRPPGRRTPMRLKRRRSTRERESI
jgi:hypothetical protein